MARILVAALRRIPRGPLHLAIPLWVLFAAAPAPAWLHGVESIRQETVYALDPDTPVTLLLSRSRYPAEDGHLDAIAWLNVPDGEEVAGELEVTLSGEDGTERARGTVAVPGRRVFFSADLPPGMAGERGSLRVAWTSSEGRLAGEAQAFFSVAAPENPPRSGRIRLTIPNDAGAVQRGLPVTLGVPFPRGTLHAEEQVRLLDDAGSEIPLQTRVAARWSRFGSVKWLHCDFAADVDGAARTFFLEFGPDVVRSVSAALDVRLREGLPPEVDTGPVRFGDGIEFNPGEGFRTAILPGGLDGAFVLHENGVSYGPAADVVWQVEEQGSEKVVLRREGWYVAGTGERFCRFNTRFILFRGSPFLRVFHTWIYTGDAYEDRIRNMGWRFPLGESASPAGFHGGADGEWIEGDHLLQYDSDRYRVVRNDRLVQHGERAPGMARVRLPGAQLLLGIKDFWQNFPNELEFADGALYVHQWPRHGRPAVHPARIEDGLRLWFAHEGEVLDFALPERWTTDPDFYYASPTRNRRAYQMRHGRETVNAQGVAKTEEMWLLFAPDDVPPDRLARTLEGLNDGWLRAVVDPVWVADSGAFYEIRHRDAENFAEEERFFERAALAPLEWVERIRFYGKWIWGNMTWVPDVVNREFGLYRGFRKAHQGWPYSWIPFARSGDPRLMRFADAATRHQADVVFCHYSDERVPGALEDGRPRPRGFSIRFRVPWGTHTVNPSSRGYIEQVDYLLHSYYLTGYHRARDVFLDWAHLTQAEGWNNWRKVFGDITNFRAPLAGDATRGSTSVLKAYVESYEATFDPWFLAAAHQIARTHVESWRDHGWRGHLWQAGPREFHRFTGCETYAEFYLAYARHFGDHRLTPDTWYPNPLEAVAYAWRLTGDEYFLRRVQAFLEWGTANFYDGEPDYLRGSLVGRGPTEASPLETAWWLQYYPLAPAVMAEAGRRPDPLPQGFLQWPPPDSGEEIAAGRGTRMRYTYRFAFRKRGTDREIPLRLAFERPPFGNLRYRLEDAAGAVMQEGQARGEAVLPADAPAGLYRLVIQGDAGSRLDPVEAGRRGLVLPPGPAGTPMVWELDERRETGPTGAHGGQYWFRAPPEPGDFWIEFRDVGRAPFARITVWDPDGGLAWQHQGLAAANPADLRASLPLAAGHAGRLWRISIAGLGYGMRLDPRIPPYLATDPLTWFNPEEESE